MSAPADLTVGTDGSIRWTPTDSQVGLHQVTVAVSDSGSPKLAATNGFAIQVFSRPVLEPLIQTGAGLLLTWNAVSNTTYRVQWKGDCNGSEWFDAGGDVQATGNTAFKTDPLTSTNRFYRVRVAP